VDLIDAANGMELAISDMVTLGYLKRVPERAVDFAHLKEVLHGSPTRS
jgi:hypothetical protein